MNTIKITLDKNASGKVAELYKDFAMYVNSYQNKLVDVYVPKEMLYTNPQNLKASETPTQFANSVKIGGILTADNGSKITTDSYYMDFLKETTINDVDYVVFERIMPKELTTYAGNQQIVINVLSVDSSVTPVKVLQVVTTQICNLLVQNSDYIGDETVVDPTKTEEFDARITQNKTDIVDLQTRMTTTESNVEQNTKDIAQNTNDIAGIKQVIGTGEDYIGTLEWASATLPTDTELNAYVYEKRQREQKSGDVIIVIQKLAGQTDKNFKYIYAVSGWTHYEIPPMELAGNGTAGIVSGTYGIGKTNDTLLDIAGGEILNIYIKDTASQYRNLVEYLNTSNTTIANIISGTTQVGNALKAVNDSVGNNIFETYLTKEFGVTKAELRDYAMPREFNDVDFISSQGYQDNVPTTPASGIQFTTTTTSVGDTQLFAIEKTNTADFELSAKNGYSNTIYVSADKDCQVQFRLTTQYKKASGDWQNLNIELSSSISLIAGNIEKLTFASPFTYLEENVISLTNGDKIRQVLEVVTTTLETIVFDVYSNQTYPSIFNLTSQSYILSDVENDTLKLISSNISNPNLLINGDFRVNQRGKTSYTLTSSAYTVDRWMGANGFTITPQTNGINITTTTNGWFQQKLENAYSDFAGKTLTISCKANGVLYLVSGTLPSETPNRQTDLMRVNMDTFGGTNICALRLTYLNDRLCVNIYVYAGSSFNLEYIKLELGSVATSFSPRPYAEELSLCQRYGCELFSSVERPYGAENIGYVVSKTQFSFKISLPTTMRKYYSLKQTTGISGTIFTTTGRIDFSNGQLTTTTARTNHNELDLMLTLSTEQSVTINTVCAVRIDTQNFVDAEIY